MSQLGGGRLRLSRYAMGNMGKNALSSMLEVYALFYCTEVLGIEPQVAGLIILVSLVWDAIVDPMIGLWADRQLVGRRTIAGLLLLGMPGTALAFVGFFHLHLLGPPLHIPSAIMLLILFRAAYTLVDVPHNSLLVLAANNSDERTRLASLRILFSAVGKMSLTVMAAASIGAHGADMASAMGQTSLIMALVFVLAVGICIQAIGRFNLPMRETTMPWRPLKALSSMFRSEKRLRMAFMLTAINSLTIPASSVVLIYSAKYQLGDPEVGARALVIQAVMQAIMPLVWVRIVGRFKEHQKVLIFAYLCLAFVSLAAVVLPMSPPNLYLLSLGSGASIAGIFMLNWVYFADALAEAREKVETDTTMGAFGIYSVVNKIFHGLAQAMAGLILAITLSPQALTMLDAPIASLHRFFLVVVLLGGLVAASLVYRRSTHLP